MDSENPKCSVCEKGELIKKKKYRMSGPVVFIGYIFLIPSILGMLLGMILLFATKEATIETISGMQEVLRQELSDANIPEEITNKVVQGKTLTDEDHSLLTDDQRSEISIAELSHGAGQFGAGAGSFIAGGLSIFMIVLSLVGGLLGWLLIMKKKVLQCTNCNAIVAAS